MKKNRGLFVENANLCKTAESVYSNLSLGESRLTTLQLNINTDIREKSPVQSGFVSG
jgi:hypothetical protein